jgi:hypothetical protein
MTKVGEITRLQLVKYASIEACQEALRALMHEWKADYIVENISTGDLEFYRYAEKLQDTQGGEATGVADSGAAGRRDGIG